MISTPADLQKMKLKQHQFSIQPRIFEGSTYVHPWYDHVAFIEHYGEDNLELHKPNPPSKEAVQRAKFVDKTYHWTGRNSSVRPRN